MKKLLLHLYPRTWRRWYGDEFLALMEDVPVSPRMIVDTVRGALDAHLQPPAAASEDASSLTAELPLAPSPVTASLSETPSLRRRPRPKGAAWESALDQIIREARERGEFDNLEGAGKPLVLDENPFAGEWGLAFHVVKQAGETLPWIALGQEIDGDKQRLQSLLDQAANRLRSPRAGAWTDDDRQRFEAERTRYRTQYLEEAARLDKKLLEFSLQVPVRRLDRGRFPPHVAARWFDETCPPIT